MMQTFKQYFVTSDGVEGKLTGLLINDSDRPVSERGKDWPSGAKASEAFVVAGPSERFAAGITEISEAHFTELRENTEALEMAALEIGGESEKQIASLMEQRNKLINIVRRDG